MLKLTAIAIAATSLATGAGAQMTGAPAATKMTTTKTVKPMPVVKSTTASRTTTTKTVTRPAVVTTSGKMATTTTKTGKKVTYDCSKKGNMTKTACKK